MPDNLPISHTTLYPQVCCTASLAAYLVIQHYNTTDPAQPTLTRYTGSAHFSLSRRTAPSTSMPKPRCPIEPSWRHAANPQHAQALALLPSRALVPAHTRGSRTSRPGRSTALHSRPQNLFHPAAVLRQPCSSHQAVACRASRAQNAQAGGWGGKGRLGGTRKPLGGIGGWRRSS